MERKYQSSTYLSWQELDERLGALASSIMAKKYVAFVAAADQESNIAAHILAEKLMAKYHPEAIGSKPNNAHAVVFKLDNHNLPALEGYACLYRYVYEDVAYNTLMTPEFYNEEIQVELDTRPQHIIYPWKLT